ncbi:MAG: hypothetical protein ACHQ6U_13095, partial [Thermodesulfobacteriota bacterium]
KYADLISQRALLQEAITKIEYQIERARMRLSKDICKAHEADYMKAGREFFLAIIRMGEATVAFDAWRRSFKDAHIAWTSCLPVITASKYGDPMSHESTLFITLKEAMRQGFITHSDIPEEWRRAWYRFSGYRIKGDTLKMTLAPCERDLAKKYEQHEHPLDSILPKREKEVKSDEWTP